MQVHAAPCRMGEVCGLFIAAASATECWLVALWYVFMRKLSLRKKAYVELGNAFSTRTLASTCRRARAIRANCHAHGIVVRSVDNNRYMLLFLLRFWRFMRQTQQSCWLYGRNGTMNWSDWLQAAGRSLSFSLRLRCRIRSTLYMR